MCRLTRRLCYRSIPILLLVLAINHRANALCAMNSAAVLCALCIHCTVGHKSHDPSFHAFLMGKGVMTFAAHCTRLFVMCTVYYLLCTVYHSTRTRLHVPRTVHQFDTRYAQLIIPCTLSCVQSIQRVL